MKKLFKNVLFVLVVALSFMAFGMKDVYAEETVTVTFDSMGGTPVESQTFEKGGYANYPDDPEYEDDEDMIFFGWMTANPDEDPTAEFFDFDLPVEESITLYALWSYEQIWYNALFVEFYGDGGTYHANYWYDELDTEEQAKQNVEFSESNEFYYLSSYYMEDEGGITVTATPQEGYAFDGWYQVERWDWENYDGPSGEATIIGKITSDATLKIDPYVDEEYYNYIMPVFAPANAEIPIPNTGINTNTNNNANYSILIYILLVLNATFLVTRKEN